MGNCSLKSQILPVSPTSIGYLSPIQKTLQEMLVFFHVCPFLAPLRLLWSLSSAASTDHFYLASRSRYQGHSPRDTPRCESVSPSQSCAPPQGTVMIPDLSTGHYYLTPSPSSCRGLKQAAEVLVSLASILASFPFCHFFATSRCPDPMTYKNSPRQNYPDRHQDGIAPRTLRKRGGNLGILQCHPCQVVRDDNATRRPNLKDMWLTLLLTLNLQFCFDT